MRISTSIWPDCSAGSRAVRGQRHPADLGRRRPAPPRRRRGRGRCRGRDTRPGCPAGEAGGAGRGAADQHGPAASPPSSVGPALCGCPGAARAEADETAGGANRPRPRPARRRGRMFSFIVSRCPALRPTPAGCPCGGPAQPPAARYPAGTGSGLAAGPNTCRDVPAGRHGAALRLHRRRAAAGDQPGRWAGPSCGTARRHAGRLETGMVWSASSGRCRRPTGPGIWRPACGPSGPSTSPACRRRKRPAGWPACPARRSRPGRWVGSHRRR